MVLELQAPNRIALRRSARSTMPLLRPKLPRLLSRKMQKESPSSVNNARISQAEPTIVIAQR